MSSQPKPGRGRAAQGSAKRYSPDEKWEILSAVRERKLSAEEVAELFGVSGTSVRNWMRAYEAHGREGLKNRGGSGQFASPPNSALRQAIVETKRRFPSRWQRDPADL